MHEEIFIFFALFALIFGYVFLRSRENMALIERGINPRKSHSGPKPFAYMKYALLLVGAGIGLFIAYMLDMTVLREVSKVVRGGHVFYENKPIYFSLLAIGGGLGLYSAYKLEKKYMDKSDSNSD